MNNKEILIIDDSPRFRKNIKIALKKEEYNFFEAESIKEGIAQLQENSNLKVILLDLSLPDGSGVDFLEKIKKLAKNFRVIILTAHEEYLAAEKAKEFSVFNYLPKASKSFTQSLRFTVEQAFIDIERDYLKERNSSLLEIQKKINTDILENSSIDETLKSLDEILALICKKVVELVGAYTCHIRLYSLSKGELFLAAFASRNDSDDEVEKIFYDPNGSFSAEVAKAKTAKVYNDLQNNKKIISFKDTKLREIKASNNEDFYNKVEKYFNTVQSAYIYPITTLMFDNETDAVFNVSSENVDFFSEDKKKIINEFVTLATSAITKAWQKRRKVESDQDYKGIYAVLENISKELKGINETDQLNVRDRIYSIFLNGISEIIKPETISVFLHNKRTNLFDLKAAFIGNKQVVPSNREHPLNKGLTGGVFWDRKPIRIPNLQIGDKRKYQEHPNYSKGLEEKYVGEIPSGRINHYLGVPMFMGEEVIGVVQLINKKSAYYEEVPDKSRWLIERGFSQDAENLLGIATSYLATSIKNAELLETERFLRDAGRYISADISLEELLETINNEAAKNVKAEICLMFLMDESKSKVVLKRSYPIPKEILKNESGEDAFYEIGEGLTGEVAENGKPALERASAPIGKYDRKILDYLNKEGENHTIESLMVVPIKVKNEILGVIKAINLGVIKAIDKKGDGEQFSEENLNFFKIFANYAGIAIRNTQHYETAMTGAKNAALSHLVRAVVHEINNTKALIPINIQLIKYKISKSDYDITEMLNVIENSAKRAVKFANSIQAFSTSRMGQRKPYDINKVIKTAIEQLTPDLNSNEKFDGISLSLNLSKIALNCSVYEEPFIQVVQNIVLNAFQAMEKSKNKILTITSFYDYYSNLVKVNFSDTGEGIKAENLEKIFHPEFTTKSGKGTGIGLWLAKTHLNNIGGELKVISVLNGGTTFTILLPVNKTTELKEPE